MSDDKGLFRRPDLPGPSHKPPASGQQADGNQAPSKEELLTMFNVSWVSDPKKQKMTSEPSLYMGFTGDPSATSSAGSRHLLQEMEDEEDSEPGMLPAATKRDGKAQKDALKHLSYYCPGLHDKDSRQDISRKTMRQLLAHYTLVIPLFQRRYCWLPKTIHKWYEDVRRGARDHYGIHNTGNLILKYYDHDKAHLLLDGQQRMTTSLLFLAALRDVGRNAIAESENPEQMENHLMSVFDTISSVLYLPADGQSKFRYRLTPCMLDRESFYHIIEGGECFSPLVVFNVDTKEVDDGEPEKKETFQLVAYNIFKTEMIKDLKRCKSDAGRVEVIEAILQQALDKMGITLCLILNDISMPQVFLWCQEKDIMGEGALLLNNSPGVKFTSVDMVRNHILSPVMDWPIHDQEEFHKRNWLEPIELKYSSTLELNWAVGRYVSKRRVAVKDISEFESSVRKMENLLGIGRLGSPAEGIRMYAEFVTVYQDLKRVGINGQHGENGDNVEFTKLLLQDLQSFLHAELSQPPQEKK